MWRNFIKKNLTKNKFSSQIPKQKLTLPQKLVEKSPKSIQPYLNLMRLDKPIGLKFLKHFLTLKELGCCCGLVIGV
jgi:hypothetical protein